MIVSVYMHPSRCIAGEMKCRTVLLLFNVVSTCVLVLLFVNYKYTRDSFVSVEEKLCDNEDDPDCSEQMIRSQPSQHGRLLKNTLATVPEPSGGELHKPRHRQEHQALGQYREESFTLSIRYMDQATWGARRLRSLQCWASQLDRAMRVVEPSINNTYLQAPVRKPVDGVLRFGDVFDINWWNQYGLVEAGFQSLVSWDEFFLYAPRKTILVEIVYQRDVWCFEDSLQESGCTLNEVKKFWMKTLRGFSFKVIRRVCIDFGDLEDVITMEELNEYIFGKIPVDMPVTVVFNDWRGPLREATKAGENNCILRYRDTTCSPSGPTGLIHDVTINALRPTPEMFHSAEVYASKYLNGNSTRYVAVMVRWELMFLEHIYHEVKAANNSGSGCNGQIKDYVSKIQETKGITTAFLATDVGKYGSKIMQPGINLYGKAHYDRGKNLTEEILQTLYGRPITLEQYDQQFAEFGGTEVSPTYFVPQLQKAIAARADCLLLVGWGSFHENTLDLYNMLHEGQECYDNIPHC